MSRLEQLPPDLHATLSLLLRQRKRPAEVAALLGIPERAVHDRAHAALALLAPAQARALSAAEREQLGEYLLGQEDPEARRAARALLERSAEARTWAQALARELAPLAALPALPGAGATGEPPVSRVGGALILGALAAAIVVVVLLVAGVGGGGGSSSGTGANASTTGTNASTTSAGKTGQSAGSGTGTTGGAGATGGTGTTGAATDGTSSTGSGGAGTGTSTGTASTPARGRALTLTTPNPATSKAIGVAYVLSQKGERAFYLFAKGLPTPPSGAFYAVWLEGAHSAPDYPLGSLPAASSSGLVEGGGPLPRSAGEYTRLIVTSETSHHPTHPGPTALSGAFSLN